MSNRFRLSWPGQSSTPKGAPTPAACANGRPRPKGAPTPAACGVGRPRVMLAGVLQSGCDAVDRPQDRLQVRGAARVTGRKAPELAQQSNLEIAHRVDVWIPQTQARQELGLALEDGRLTGDLQHGVMRSLKLRSDDGKETLPLAERTRRLPSRRRTMPGAGGGSASRRRPRESPADLRRQACRRG